MNSPTSEETERFRLAIARSLGLQFDAGKRDFLADLLRQRLQQLGLGHAAAYLAHLATAAGIEEWRPLASALTVPETYFFRNRDQFRALTECILPDLFRMRASSKRLRILSAGCASGEEAYSLAMLLRRQFSDRADWEYRILGIDINPAVLEKARRGLYLPWSMRETADDDRDHFFRAQGRAYVLSESVREAVSFEERNLTREDPAFWHADAFDLVLCRNVTMYFSLDVTRGVIARIGRSLSPGGYLLLGHAETLRGISNDFHLCHTHETFYYQVREGAPDRRASEVWAPAPEAATLAAEAPAAVSFEPDASWVDAIQRASSRIESLASRSVPPSAVQRAPASAPRLSGAMELVVQERFAEAMESLDALPPEARGNPDAQLLQAALLTNAGQLDRAEELCRALLSNDEMNAGAHYVMALCGEHRGDFASAEEHDHAACYLDGQFAMPRVHLGLMARRSGKLEAARRELALAIPLLLREDASRMLLFGGGFSREALVALCRAELQRAGGGA